jgi:hypothetical protein
VIYKRPYFIHFQRQTRTTISLLGQLTAAYYYYQYSALGPVWQEPGPSQMTGMALARCILGKFLGVVCHCFPLPLDIPTHAARCLHIPNNASAPSSERWNYQARNDQQIVPVTQLPCNHRVL